MTRVQRQRTDALPPTRQVKASQSLSEWLLLRLSRSRGAADYAGGGLNRMTLRKFDRLLAEVGLRVLYRRNEGVKGLHFLTKIPVLRELFTNNIACELARE